MITEAEIHETSAAFAALAPAADRAAQAMLEFGRIAGPMWKEALTRAGLACYLADVDGTREHANAPGPRLRTRPRKPARVARHREGSPSTPARHRLR